MKYIANPWIPFKFKNKIIKLPIARGVTHNLLRLRFNWMTTLIGDLSPLENDEGVFLDIGANLGQTLIHFHAGNSRLKYIGFEPESYCVVFLKKLIELNKFNKSLIVPVGISNNNRLLKLHSSSITDSGSTLREDIGFSRKLFYSVVPTFKLDDVLMDLNVKRVSLMKIDVEGFELEVLKGMEKTLKTNRPLIICEILFRNPEDSHEKYLQRSRELVEVLTKSDYCILQLQKTVDLKLINDAKEVADFSDEVWQPINKNLCDYLFVPKERNAQQLINGICKR